MIPRLLLANDRSLGFGSVGPHKPGQQVEPRFVLKNQHTALTPRPPLQLRPDLLTPASNSVFVALDGPPDGHLGRPVQFCEQPADVVLVVADTELLFDHLGDAGAGPDLSAEAISLGAVPQKFGDQTLLVGRQMRRRPWGRVRAEGVGATVSCGGKPLADSRFGDAKNLGDGPLRPTVLMENRARIRRHSFQLWNAERIPSMSYCTGLKT